MVTLLKCRQRMSGGDMVLKKVILLILMLTLLLSLIGCTRDNKKDVVLSSNKDNIKVSVIDKVDGESLEENNRDNFDMNANEDKDANEDKSVNEEIDNNKENEDNKDKSFSYYNEGREKTENEVNAKYAEDSTEAISDNNDDSHVDTISPVANENNSSYNLDRSDSKEEKLSELGELSRKLALQMSKGDFKKTHDSLSPQLKLQLTLSTLEQGWINTVADMGGYKSVREITEEISASGTVINVILDYDNSGVRVLFSYSKNSKKLDGLWINFAPYESVANDDSYEEINISFGDSKNPIEGKLTLPKNIKNPPVAILVHGSGTHDEDETIGVNKPFRDLAHGLAKKGIAVIRYKENIPKSLDEYTIEDDCLNAASHAIKYAWSCGKVDTDRIIVIGHSLGGMMAPKIAADNKEVGGIVSLAGSPRRLEDIVLDQVKILNKADESITEAVYKFTLAQVNAQVKKVKELKESSSELILGSPASYWYSLNQIDTSSIVKGLDIPIFIAQGSEDFQVYANIDYLAWQELLKGKNNVTCRLYDNLNHLFMPAQGRMDISEYNIKGTMEHKVIDDIAKWILKM